MRAHELNGVSHGEWLEVIAGEESPWGAAGAELSWRDKQRHVGIRDGAGHLVALAGTVVASVRVAGGDPFEVVGIGGVIVTRELRGRGLGRELLERTMRLAEEQGPERAMLFCRPALMPLYAKLSFAPVGAPVWADQPGGRIEMPMPSMWRALAPGADWPPGRVDVLGEPF